MSTSGSEVGGSTVPALTTAETKAETSTPETTMFTVICVVWLTAVAGLVTQMVLARRERTR